HRVRQRGFAHARLRGDPGRPCRHDAGARRRHRAPGWPLPFDHHRDQRQGRTAMTRRIESGDQLIAVPADVLLAALDQLERASAMTGDEAQSLIQGAYMALRAYAPATTDRTRS